jgi:hypothetical protein
MLSTEDIQYKLWGEDDRFMMVASVAFWDVISEQDVVCQAETSLGQNENGKHIVDALVDKAYQIWKVSDPDNHIPDISVLFLMAQ